MKFLKFLKFLKDNIYFEYLKIKICIKFYLKLFYKTPNLE